MYVYTNDLLIKRMNEYDIFFGESGYIPLDEDTEPNFLGETMTATEFAEEEAQDKTMQTEGMGMSL